MRCVTWVPCSAYYVHAGAEGWVLLTCGQHALACTSCVIPRLGGKLSKTYLSTSLTLSSRQNDVQINQRIDPSDYSAFEGQAAKARALVHHFRCQPGRSSFQKVLN